MKKKRFIKMIAILALTLTVTTSCGMGRNTDNTSDAVWEVVTPESNPSEKAAPDSSVNEPSKEVTKGEGIIDTVENTLDKSPETVKESEAENIEAIIKDIDYSKYENLAACINDLGKYNTLMLIVYGDDGVNEILIDGDSYTYDENMGHKGFYLNRLQSAEANEIESAYISTSEIDIYSMGNKGFYFPFEPYFTDGLYTIVVEYKDGTKDEMTIDFTFIQNTANE